MAASDDARPNSLGHPGLDHEVARAGLDPHQPSRSYSDPDRVLGMNPEGVGMSDLVEPLRVRAPGVNLNGKPERRDEGDLALLEVLRVNLALDVARERVLRPAPRRERRGVELELAARSGKAADDSGIVLDSHRPPSFGVAGRCRLRNDVDRRRLRRPGERAAARIHAHVLELLLRHLLLVEGARALRGFEGSVAGHVGERCEALRGGLLWKTGDGVLEDVPVVLVDSELFPRALARLEELADPHPAVRIDSPGELDPKLVLLPDPARIRAAAVRHLLSH